LSYCFYTTILQLPIWPSRILQTKNKAVHFAHLLDLVVTSGDTWCFQYNPQTEDKAMNGARQTHQNKNFDFRSQETKWFWSHSSTVREYVHKGIVPPGQTVKNEDYVEIFFVQSILRVSPKFQARGSHFLLHENARPPTSEQIRQVFAKQILLNKSPSWFIPTTLFLIPRN
jgi:hypothetical protein